MGWICADSWCSSALSDHNLGGWKGNFFLKSYPRPIPRFMQKNFENLFKNDRVMGKTVPKKGVFWAKS